MGKNVKVMFDSPVMVKAKGTVMSNGVYCFNKEELQEKGHELVVALQEKRTVENEKKAAMQEFKNTLAALEADQYLVESDIETGERNGNMDCLMYLLEENGALYKVYESLEFGVEINRELFDYYSDRFNFEFAEEKDFDSIAKKVFYQGFHILTVPMTDAERQMNIDDIESAQTAQKYKALNEGEKAEAGEDKEV